MLLGDSKGVTGGSFSLSTSSSLSHWCSVVSSVSSVKQERNVVTMAFLLLCCFRVVQNPNILIPPELHRALWCDMHDSSPMGLW